MKEFRELNFKEYQQHWHDLHIAIFGKEIADEMLLADKKHYQIMQKLWQEKGFKTVGEYLDWENNHKDERNAYFIANGENYDNRSNRSLSYE